MSAVVVPHNMSRGMQVERKPTEIRWPCLFTVNRTNVKWMRGVFGRTLIEEKAKTTNALFEGERDARNDELQITK